MERDLRRTSLYNEIAEHFRQAYEPAFGYISGATEPAPSPDGRSIAFTGSKLERLEGVPATRICLADVQTGAVEEITGGPNNDRLPRWSPDGTQLAFLSDRKQEGVQQLYLLRSDRVGEAIPTPAIEGTVEYFSWSLDGRSILLAVAGLGAELAGAQGSGTTKVANENLPAWMPAVDSGVAENGWRRVWVYDIATGTSRQVSRAGLNIWEAVWADPDHIAAIASQTPTEDAWYTSPLVVFDVETGQEEVRYESRRQLGLPAASPSGRHLAVVQAVCSDRWIVAGDLLVLSPGAVPIMVDTGGVDITWLAWRDEARLFFAGLRGLRSVYGEYDVEAGSVRELWSTAESSGNWFPQAVPMGEQAFALVLEGYDRYPEVTIVEHGTPRTVASLAHPGSEYLRRIGGRLEELTWTAPDGLSIEGLLALPEGQGPHPLVLYVHGGPVSAYRNRWQIADDDTRLLVSRGYAVLHPNPRGSAGRGQAFAEHVYGDMGGADTEDYLAGIDEMIARGIADPARLGVMGVSYGGFMTSWLVTQTDRFTAAVSGSPVTDWLSHHYTCNIGFFDRIFLQDNPDDLTGRYFTRSPMLFAGRVRTPTLHTAGSLDRCTPAGQATEFHQALLEHGVTSTLVVYPQEGHGVRRFPTILDWATRVIGWFERFMPART